MKKIIALFRAAMDGENYVFTEGSVRRAIVLLSIPLILEMLMESLFSLVDVFFVARVGTDAVATVGITEAVITLIYSVGIGFGAAITAMVSRRIGEKNPDAAARATAQAIWLGLGASVLIGIAGWFGAESLLITMGASEGVLETGLGYTRVLLASSGIIIFLFMLNGVLRGAGEAALSMRVLWLANGINIVLDPILIFGLGSIPAFGVEGAAYATVVGRSIGVAYQVHLLCNGRSKVQLRLRHFMWQPIIMRRLVGLSAGGMGQYLIASASWIFLMRIIAVFGSDVVAGYTIAIRLLIFTLLPSWGLANAAATLVGQNLGAGKPERAEQSVYQTARYNVIFLLSVSVLYFLAAPMLLGFFSEVPEVVQAGVLSLRIICSGYLFFAYGMVLGQAFNGAGDTRTPTIANFVCFWLIEIPLGYFLAVTLGFGPAGVYTAVAISESLLALIFYVLFRRGRWKLVEV